MQAPRRKAGWVLTRSLAFHPAGDFVRLSQPAATTALPPCSLRRAAAVYAALATLGVARVYSGLRRTEINNKPKGKIQILHYFEVNCKPKKLSPVLVSHGTVIFEVGAADNNTGTGFYNILHFEVF